MPLSYASESPPVGGPILIARVGFEPTVSSS